MAGNALMYGVIGFIAGVVVANSVRSLVQEHLGFEIPSLYAQSYPAEVADYDTQSFYGKTFERDYDSALEMQINHVNIE